MATFEDGTSTNLLYDYENYQGFLDPKKDRSLLMTPRPKGFGMEGIGWGFRGANLFLEIFQLTSSKTTLPPLYTMLDREINELPSAHQIYIHSADEYEAAMKLVGSWKHWKKVMEHKWFREGYSQGSHKWEGLDVWREELEIKKKSRATRALLNLVSQNDRGAATRLLEEYKPKKRGRPSKEEVKQEARIEAGLMQDLDSDLKRLQYSPIN